MKVAVSLAFLFASISGIAQTSTRQIAVTIDDLPVVSTRRDLKNRQEITKKLLGHIRKEKIPAIGFVNENKLYDANRLDEREVGLLRMWIDAGLELGNHTFSHHSLNRIDLEEYKSDVLNGQTVTSVLLKAHGNRLRYFRHPFLQTGRSMEVKAKFDIFLKENGYIIAPVSFDNADYIFARAFDNANDKNNKKLVMEIGEAYVPYMLDKLEYWEKQSRRLFGREVSQTLLIHANFINSVYLDDLAAEMRLRGYKFVSLEEALKDEAYRSPDTYIGPAGISWLHRWALERGREFVVPDEPKVPDFVLKASGFESE